MRVKPKQAVIGDAVWDVKVVAIHLAPVNVHIHAEEPAHERVQMIAFITAKKRAVEVANILVEAVVLIAIGFNNGLF